MKGKVVTPAKPAHRERGRVVVVMRLDGAAAISAGALARPGRDPAKFLGIVHGPPRPRLCALFMALRTVRITALRMILRTQPRLQSALA